MKFQNRRATVFAAVALVASLGLTACGGDDGGSDDAGSGGDNGGGDALSITFLPKNLGNPYFDTSNAGGEEAIEEFGGSSISRSRQPACSRNIARAAGADAASTMPFLVTPDRSAAL